eukprot:UN06818
MNNENQIVIPPNIQNQLQQASNMKLDLQKMMNEVVMNFFNKQFNKAMTTRGVVNQNKPTNAPTGLNFNQPGLQQVINPASLNPT